MDEQLKQIGSGIRVWGRRELHELSRVMTETEEIKQCVNGHYQGGFGMLVATDQRLMLIDRKPMFLTLEVIWYDKIVQVDFNHRLLNATLCVSTPNKDLTFTTWNSGHLKEIMLYTQERMTEAKEQQERWMNGYGHGATDHYHYQGRPSSIQPLAYAGIQQPTAANEPYKKGAPVAVGTEHIVPNQDVASMQTQVPPTKYDTTLYAATRLPFSRRRYFAAD